jgi:hypothetical protein
LYASFAKDFLQKKKLGIITVVKRKDVGLTETQLKVAWRFTVGRDFMSLVACVT